VLDRRNKFERPWTFGDLAVLNDKDRKDKKEEFFQSLIGRTVVASVLLCGLSEDGMLDKDAEDQPRTVDDGAEWMQSDEQGRPAIRFRVRPQGTAEATSDGSGEWREEYRFALDQNEDGEAAWLLIEQWLDNSETEEGRALARNNQTLSDHREAAQHWAHEIAAKLRLPKEYVDVLATAARLHDEGKKASIWQRAFNAPRGEFYAKTKGPLMAVPSIPVDLTNPGQVRDRDDAAPLSPRRAQGRSGGDRGNAQGVAQDEFRWPVPGGGDLTIKRPLICRIPKDTCRNARGPANRDFHALAHGLA
jgi:hypothetical protein